MKVLHVPHRFAPCLGGIETHVSQLCKSLKGKGIETRVACLNKCPGSGKALPKEETIAGVKVKRLGFLDLGLYKIAPGIFGALGKADIVHVHGLGFFSDFLALTKFLHRKRLVLSSHGAVFHTGRAGFLKRIYFFGLCRLSLKMFDKVIAVSSQDLALFGRIAPKKKISLIENPVEIGNDKTAKQARDKESFLFVGRLSKNKGIGRLLEAFAVVCKQRPGARLCIVGQDFDGLQKGFVEKAKGLGIADRVLFKGRVSGKELAGLYKKAEFFVSGSAYEGFGITALEAMAAGQVAVLSGIPTFSRFAQGGKAITADFSKPEKAGQTIVRAIGLSAAEKKDMVAKARAYADSFSWDKKITHFVELYNQL